MASTSDVTATSIFRVNTPVLPGSTMITTDKLNDKNYLSWAASVELWCKGLSVSEHLTSSIDHIPVASRDQWERVDAQILDLIWQPLTLACSLSLDWSVHVMVPRFTSKNYTRAILHTCTMWLVFFFISDRKILICSLIWGAISHSLLSYMSYYLFLLIFGSSRFSGIVWLLSYVSMEFVQS